MKKQLTSKQRHFARAWASGMSLSDAYREAYDVSDSTTAASVHTLASRQASRVEVRSRYEQLLKEKDRQIAASAVSRRDRVLDWLEGVYQGTEDADAVRVRAAELTGKASGLFETNINVTSHQPDSSGIAAEIEAMLLAATADESDTVEQDKPEHLH
ncbi:MAG: hypothetical protein CMF29_01040 [Kiritimatiellaceae bacterium]|nr:hypothetical protein [Kiritimatiellaceae bacterium]